MPPSRSTLLWRDAVVAVVRSVQSIAVELNAAKREAALRRTTLFPAVSFFLVIVVLRVGNLS